MIIIILFITNRKGYFLPKESILRIKKVYSTPNLEIAATLRDLQTSMLFAI